MAQAWLGREVTARVEAVTLAEQCPTRPPEHPGAFISDPVMAGAVWLLLGAQVWNTTSPGLGSPAAAPVAWRPGLLAWGACTWALGWAEVGLHSNILSKTLKMRDEPPQENKLKILSCPSHREQDSGIAGEAP